jgi:hypothetical protein
VVFTILNAGVNSAQVLPMQSLRTNAFFITGIKEIDSNVMRSPAKMDELISIIAKFLSILPRQKSGMKLLKMVCSRETCTFLVENHIETLRTPGTRFPDGLFPRTF